MRALLVVLVLIGTAAMAQLPSADTLCAAHTGSCVDPPYVAVQSAFPAEIEPLLGAAQLTETIVDGGRTYHVGTLGGTHVVLVRGGIGLTNAADTATALIERFDLKALLFSGVAGSGLDIGDVAIPATWIDLKNDPGSSPTPVTSALLAVAQTLVTAPITLEQCTLVPPDSTSPQQNVCLDHAPKIVVGGRGESNDPYGDKPFQCQPGPGPVFGCDTPIPQAAVAEASTPPDSTDMETAAVARVALQQFDVPFLGIRGVSDGGGDPLHLVGAFTEFFAYYRLSADNAALVTTAFLGAAHLTDLPSGAAPPPARRVTPRGSTTGAACDWEDTGGEFCFGQRAPQGVTNAVARACAADVTSAALDPATGAGGSRPLSAAKRGRKLWKTAARLVRHAPHRRLDAGCRHVLTAALEARAAAAANP